MLMVLRRACTSAAGSGVVPGLSVHRVLQSADAEAAAKELDGMIPSPASGFSKRSVKGFYVPTVDALRSQLGAHIAQVVLDSVDANRVLFPDHIDSVQINAYQPHPRDGPVLPAGAVPPCPLHVDDKSLGPAIGMISLRGPCTLDLEEGTGEEDATDNCATLPPTVPARRESVAMENGSLVLLTEDARYRWRHGIASGNIWGTQTRYSIVFWKGQRITVTGRAEKLTQLKKPSTFVKSLPML